MSDYMGDLGGYFATPGTSRDTQMQIKRNNEKLDLDMHDFLILMVTELKSQTMDNTADTSEMLNQMVMMQMVSALTNMTDASIMSYAASLVGKTVTVGQFDAEGNLQEIVGTVTGTGTMNGQQVVFVDDKYYYMNEIMAVGKLPPKPAPPTEGGETKPEGGETKPEGGEGTKPESGEGTKPDTVPPEGETKPDEVPPAEKASVRTSEFFPGDLL